MGSCSSALRESPNHQGTEGGLFGDQFLKLGETGINVHEFRSGKRHSARYVRVKVVVPPPSEATNGVIEPGLGHEKRPTVGQDCLRKRTHHGRVARHSVHHDEGRQRFTSQRPLRDDASGDLQVKFRGLAAQRDGQ